MRNGLLMVTACPIALCGLSGATTTTSPRCFMASTKLRIPGAVIPSSLLTSIKGFLSIRANVAFVLG